MEGLDTSYQSRMLGSREVPATASKDSCCSSLPPTLPASPLSPRRHQTGASAGGAPGQSRHTGSGHGSSTECVRMASAEGLYKTELRETTQTTSRQCRNVMPVGEKEAAPLST